MDKQKPKVEGWRKLGIGVTGITSLSVSSVEFKIAVIIGLITIVGIITQGLLDRKDNVQKSGTVN